MAQLFSLLMPRAVGALILGGIVFLGSFVNGIIRSLGEGTALNEVFRWLVLYVPEFSKLNLTTRYTDGIAALGAGTFLALLGYVVLYLIVCHLLSHHLFRRRPL